MNTAVTDIRMTMLKYYVKKIINSCLLFCSKISSTSSSILATLEFYYYNSSTTLRGYVLGLGFIIQRKQSAGTDGSTDMILINRTAAKRKAKHLY